MLGSCLYIVALLSPFSQSVREIRAIFSEPSFLHKIPAGENIQSIMRTDDGYLLTTSHHQLQISVEYLPHQQPGPVPFQLYFSEMAELCND